MKRGAQAGAQCAARPSCSAQLQRDPSVVYHVEQLPGGGAEIVFPTLVPGEQVTVGYLYYPPVLWSNVNSSTKSDEGFAKIVNVLPTPQPSVWVLRGMWALIVLGAVTTTYIIVEGARALVRIWVGA